MKLEVSYLNRLYHLLNSLECTCRQRIPLSWRKRPQENHNCEHSLAHSSMSITEPTKQNNISWSPLSSIDKFHKILTWAGCAISWKSLIARAVKGLICVHTSCIWVTVVCIRGAFVDVYNKTQTPQTIINDYPAFLLLPSQSEVERATLHSL